MKSTPFDNYVIFTNRKLSGETHSTIVRKLQDGLGIANTQIKGREDINAYLNDYPYIANQFGLHKFAEPLRFYEKDLKNVIIVFAEQSKTISKEAALIIPSFDMIEKEKKNKLNNLSEEYFEFIKTHSLQYLEQIDLFLKAPQNIHYLQMYTTTVSDLQAKIILERTRFNDFMYLIEYLVDFIVDNNREQLNNIRNIVRVFIHFMYFNCDIGKIQ
jgi:hypothetical protein